MEYNLKNYKVTKTIITTNRKVLTTSTLAESKSQVEEKIKKEFEDRLCDMSNMDRYEVEKSEVLTSNVKFEIEEVE